MNLVFDFTGKRVGRLIAIDRADLGKHREVRWRCVCDCGNECIVRTQVLRTRKNPSCGCWKITHGESVGLKTSSEYNSWRSMKQRCNDPNHEHYDRYGGRGITVCEAWSQSFETFLAYVGRKPAHGYSIDRIDNDGNYEPGNVRWATKKEQARNQHRHYGKRRVAAGASA